MRTKGFMPIWFDMLVMSDYVPFFILTKCHWGRPFLFRKGPGAVRISMAGLSLLQSAS